MITDGNSGVRIPVRRAKSSVTERQPESELHQVVDEGIVEMQTGCQDDIAEWRDIAIRLKADMANYRKRQQRWAQDEVQREKDRLLLGFVDVLDNLAQAVSHLDPDSATHQGVKIAYDNMLKLLFQEGVERIDAQDAPFDPQWHDAVAMVPALNSQREAMLVTEVVNNGYRIGDRLLKPSRVVVGKRGIT